MGQSRPNWAVRATSGLPPIATELRTSRIGSFVPRAAIGVVYMRACYSSPTIEANSSIGMRGMLIVYSTELVSA